MSYCLDIGTRKKTIEDFMLKHQPLVNMELASSVKDYQLAKVKESTILVEDGLNPSQILEMCINRNLKHVIQNSKMSLDQKFAIAQKLLRNPIESLNFDFPLFESSDINHTFEFSSDTNRSKLLSTVLDKLGVDIKNHNQQHIVTSVEELIMNAQVHAPRYGAFKSPHRMSFLMEKKDDYVALSVFDDYGTLTINKFLNKILNTFTLGVKESINYGTGGAGLGSSIIFANAEVLYIGVLPKRITRVTVLCPLKKREKEKELEQKSIQIIDKL